VQGKSEIIITPANQLRKAKIIFTLDYAFHEDSTPLDFLGLKTESISKGQFVLDYPSA
jgi:hypothetical protein